MVEHLANGPGHRVGHVAADAIGVEADLLGHGLAPGLELTVFALDDDPPRNAHRSSAGRHRLGDHRIGADLGPGTDGERPQHLGAGADHHAVLQGRVALALVPAGATQGHALIQRDIVADLGGFADDDAHAMVNEEAPADGGAGVDLDAGHPAPEVGHQARQPFEVALPQGIAQAVQPDRVHAGVAGQHLEGVARRRVSMEYALDIFTQTFEHLSVLPFMRIAPCDLLGLGEDAAQNAHFRTLDRASPI